MPFIAFFAGFFSVLSAAWSQTSFGLTLVRLCQGWAKWVIWFIIITVNLILGTAMLLMWVKCRPFAKIWDDRIQGRCIYPKKIVTFYRWSADNGGPDLEQHFTAKVSVQDAQTNKYSSLTLDAGIMLNASVARTVVSEGD
ncbi:hypothetical protein NEMBOFW57_009493 [Staphylotrichum longicolle]|uniref:Uncharacterized protein n=1 Tax=Staphylotrichum longicolle TaxID=669026 RepID=A0AAD4EP53_9PEZI|nr:hypothetical protein NEMBOFW57_009493 [Staphylotrichum longicolle]